VGALVQEATTRCQPNVAGLNLLAIPDTSEINYQRHAGILNQSDADLGSVGNNRDRGGFLPPMLILEEQNGFLLGFSFNRSWEQEIKEERKDKPLPITEKESYRWLDRSFRTKELLSQDRMEYPFLIPLIHPLLTQVIQCWWTSQWQGKRHLQ